MRQPKMTKTQRVLVVEDEWIVGRAVQKTLETAGFGVTDVVASAAEAIESVERQLPDLILLDIALQDGADGVQLAHELKSRTTAPIVFVTAHADEHTLARAAEVVPAGFVVKPFQESQLLSAVTMAIRQTRVPRPETTDAPVGPDTRAEPDGVPTPNPSWSGPRAKQDSPADGRRHQLRQVAAAVSQPVPASDKAMDLTSRELEIVRLLLSNGRVTSIADRLSISPHTVRNHLRSIFRKLDVHSQVELIRELSSFAIPPTSSPGVG